MIYGIFFAGVECGSICDIGRYGTNCQNKCDCGDNRSSCEPQSGKNRLINKNILTTKQKHLHFYIQGEKVVGKVLCHQTKREKKSRSLFLTYFIFIP